MSSSRSKKQRTKNALPRSSLGMVPAVWVYLGLVAVASLLPPSAARLWGIQIGAWLPAGIWMPVLLFPFLWLLPSLHTRASSFVFDAEARRSAHRRRLAFVLIILAAGLVLTVILFKVAYPFLGDGVVYRSEVFRLLNDPDRASALIKPTSVLTGALIEAIARMLRPEHTDTPYFIVCLIAMAVFLAFSHRMLRGSSFSYRLLMVSPVLLGAGVLLFYTYVELYMLQYVFASLYCISVFSWRQRIHGTVLPTVLLLLSIGFGLSSIIFLPSLLLLLLLAHHPSALHTLRRRSGFLLALAGSAGIAIALLHVVPSANLVGQFLLPFTASATEPALDSLYTRYTVFSSAHLLDIVNVLLLNLGPLLLLIPWLLKRMKFRDLLEDDISFVMLAAVFGGGLQLLFGASSFALARDWDLMLLPTLPFAYLALRLLLLQPEKGTRALVAVWSMSAMAATTALWIAVNVTPLSAHRFESILDQDRDWIGPEWLRDGYRTIVQYHGLSRRDTDADRILRKMLDLGYRKLDTYESYFLHVLQMEGSREGMQAAMWMMDAMARDDAPRQPRESWKYVSASALHSKLASVIIETASTWGREDIVSEALLRYAPLIPNWKEAGLLRALVSTGLPAAERYALVKDVGLTDESDPLLYPYRANLAQLAGLCDTAVYYFEEMIARDKHTYPRAYLGLAQVHLNCTRDTLAAIRSLERLQMNCLLAEERQLADRLLKELKAGS